MRCYSKLEPNKKVLCLLLTICFLVASTNICLANQEKTKDDLCYGFVIPLVKYGNIDLDNKIIYNIYNAINGLLRENIPVYWTSTNTTVTIKEILSSLVLSDEKELFFDKGSFLVPFTGNNEVDTKLSVIIFDYNQSSEIEENNIEKIPAGIIVRPIELNAYLLSEVKIAQYRNKVTTGDMCLLKIAKECGFLDLEFIDHLTIEKKLNNIDYNIIAWPGAGPEYSSFFKNSVFFSIYEDLNYGVSKKIRDFVSNGGGFTGSCYGAFISSTGLVINKIPTYLKRRNLNTKLNSIGIFAISDIIVNLSFFKLIKPETYSKINNDSHPITYGLDELVDDFLWGGPEVLYVGDNSEAVASFCDSNNSYNGKPSWISSRFGQGKVITFVGHPEILGWSNSNRNHTGKIVMSNTLFYSTCGSLTEVNTAISRDTLSIQEILNKTADLSSYLQDSQDIFKELKISISQMEIDIKNLDVYLEHLKELILTIANEKDVNKTDLGYASINEPVLYYLHPFCEYLENTTKTLETLEKIYPIMKNDTCFVENIGVLKSDLLSKIDNVTDILSNSNKLSKDFEELLLKYQAGKGLEKIRTFMILDKAHKFHWEIFFGFYYIPQTYLNSLKLSRSTWYDFETMLAS